MPWDVGRRQLEQVLGQGTVDWLLSNPMLAAAAVFGLVLLFVLGWYLLTWYRRSAGESFRRLLASQSAVTILLHPNPDPDAMAAAMAVAEMADTVDTEATMRFPGEIRHQENRAFRTILGLELEVVETAEDLEDPVILVDHNEARGFHNAGAVDPIAVVDHHPGEGTGAQFTDVRPEYGACATIITEYFQSIGYEARIADRDEDVPPGVIPTTVATGLTYGILSDTTNLTKGCTDAEFAAAAFLYEGVDRDLLDRIANPQVDAEVLEVKAKAINEREVEGPYAVAHIGDVSNVDAIPQAADELLKLEGVTAVVVGGTKDGVLHLSGRSRDDRVHMGKALERVVEGIPQSGAGGHARMGGGQIDLEYMQGLGPGSGLSMEEFERRLFRSLAGEEIKPAA